MNRSIFLLNNRQRREEKLSMTKNTLQNIANIINGLTAFDVDYTHESTSRLILASAGP